MSKPDSLFSRLARDLIWVFIGISFALLFVQKHVDSEMEVLLTLVQWVLGGMAFLLSLVTKNIAGVIATIILSFLLPMWYPV